ncbi:PAS domain-containing sensor histidine kinase [Trichlorobacter ammonificans]|uniref:histidine kinase n=1 Tax=Trichlorobacter ammonificans TaxID=2916410 RepID=A0ABM9DB53_9BACT|nr:ATP-binding protein [Trichlorobacter ammonificans]CAH2031570.1 putative Histidine kinase [Trichlorobacter ammonificans]
MNGITNRQAALRVVLIYCLFGIGWILLSDTLVRLLVTDPDLRYTVSLFKGWLYVAFTALLLFLLVRHELKLLEAAEDRIRQFSSLLEDSSQPFAVGYPDGLIGLHNRAFQELVGYTSEELARIQWATELTPSEWWLIEQAALDELNRTGQPVQYKKEYRHKSGRRVPVQVFVHRKMRDDGSLHYYYAFVNDISELKRREEELQRARIAAEVAAQAKTIFLQTMSHELRTPLNGIIGATQLLADEPLSHDGREYLEMARQSARNLTALIADILDMADIESNALVLVDQPLHLPELLDSLEQLYRYGADRKGLTLSFSIDGAVPEAVLADRNRLAQVLASLLSNACKFSEQGAVVVTVAYDKLPEGGILLFTVRDEGIGISAEQQAGIFELFTQADGSTTRVHGGTGLGLALCKRLVELMGGRIWIESASGEGTTVRFTLPVRQDKA